MEIINVEYEFSSVLNDIVNMTMNKTIDKGLSYELNADPDIPSVFFGDEIRIRQVMLNIINNAIKYTKEGVIMIDVSFDKESSSLIVEVNDTGIGIKKDDLEKLFKSFQRLEESKNRKIEGTGLGLNITKQLVEMMDGSIEVKSEYGKGSSFLIKVKQKVINETPIGDFSETLTQARLQREEYKPALIAPKARILIVDDNEMNLEVISALLSDTKIRISTALSGKECLKILEKVKFDMILLDQMMPGMSGIETLSLIKENNLAPDTPVVALTADAIVGARDTYIKEGFTDYLSKPVMFEDLENILLKYFKKDLIGDLDVTNVNPEEKPIALVISDSPDKTNKVRDLLSDKYKGVYVKDEERAKKYLSNHKVDLIIRDGGGSDEIV